MAQIGVQKIVQRSVSPVLSGDGLSKTQMPESDFHHLSGRRRISETLNQLLSNRTKHFSRGLRGFILKPQIYTQPCNPCGLAEHVEERFPNDPGARLGAVMGPLHGSVNVYLCRHP